LSRFQKARLKKKKIFFVFLFPKELKWDERKRRKGKKKRPTQTKNSKFFLVFFFSKTKSSKKKNAFFFFKKALEVRFLSFRLNLFWNWKKSLGKKSLLKKKLKIFAWKNEGKENGFSPANFFFFKKDEKKPPQSGKKVCFAFTGKKKKKIPIPKAPSHRMFWPIYYAVSRKKKFQPQIAAKTTPFYEKPSGFFFEWQKERKKDFLKVFFFKCPFEKGLKKRAMKEKKKKKPIKKGALFFFFF